MNMKLLCLLAALLALSYANSDARTARTFCELLKRLKSLEEHGLNGLNKSEPITIQTPHEILNACECKEAFAEHLLQFLKPIRSIVPRTKYANIADNLRALHRAGVKNESNCNFKPSLVTFTSEEIKTSIRKNIEFIQNWNSICKSNHSCPGK